MIKYLVFLASLLYTTSAYSQLGNIPLDWPENNATWDREEQPYISWSKSDNQTQDQVVTFTFTITVVEEGQTPEQAIEENDAWFSREVGPRTNPFGGSSNIPSVSSWTKYAWKVTASDDNGIFAESDVWTFNGPNLFNDFYAGNNRIEVLTISNTDLSSFAGTGQVRLTSSATDWTPITFSDIEVKNSGGIYVINSGSIEIENDSITTITLDEQIQNNVANPSYQIQKYLLNKGGLFAISDLEFFVPLDASKFISIRDTLNYKSLSIVGTGEISSNLEIVLDANTTLMIDSTSSYAVNSSGIKVEYSGKITMDDSQSNEGYEFTFSNVTDLSFFENSASIETTYAGAINFSINSTNYIFDVSDIMSPQGFEHTQNGIFLLEYSVNLEPNVTEDLTIGKQGLTITEDSTALVGDGKINFTSTESTSIDGTLFDLAISIDSVMIQGGEDSLITLSTYGNMLLPLNDTDTEFNYTISSGGSSSALINEGGTLSDLIFPIIEDTSEVDIESFRISWLDTAQNTQYTVQLSTDNFTTVEREVETTDNAILVSGLTSATNYAVRIQAVYSNGFTSFSNAIEMSTLEIPLSADRLNNDRFFVIHPNPSVGTIRFDENMRALNSLSARLFTMDGKMLLNLVDIDGRELEHELNEKLHDLPDGVYPLSIQHHEFFKSIKLIVE